MNVATDHPAPSGDATAATAASPGPLLGRIPIKWKVVSIALSLTLVGLVIVFIGVTVNGYVLFKRNVAHNTTVLADVIGSNSRAAIVFNDAKTARETLAALNANQRITRAILYDAAGNPLAEYAPLAPTDDADDATRDVNLYEVSRDIYLDGRLIGRIMLTASLDDWNRSQRNLTLVFAALALLTVGATFLIAIFLQRIITTPIIRLANSMRLVSENKDYGIRVPRTSADEIGVLIDGFNTMLREIRRQDMELRASHMLLEQRVAERTQQLEALNKELEAFCYSVSHDLRAPLRSIDGFSNILVSEYAGALDETGVDRLNRIRRAAQHMGTLIDDLLQLSRVTRTEIKYQHVNLSAIATEIIGNLQRQYPDRAVQIDVTPAMHAAGDPNLLRIALENLLNNAWKFTGRRADARIEFGAEPRDGHTAYFVRDNGAGFDMRYAHKLFNAFQRLHDANEFPGTGIGLATVQRIIHRHGGNVWAEGVAGSGATFYFTLPQEVTNG